MTSAPKTTSCGRPNLPRRGCRCGECQIARRYARDWVRDQRARRTGWAIRQRESNARWARRNRLVVLMYHQLLSYVRRDERIARDARERYREEIAEATRARLRTELERLTA